MEPNEQRASGDVRVVKFGGSSVADAAAAGIVADIVGEAAREGTPLVVVCSALRGVTDDLIRLARRAAAEDGGWKVDVDRIEDRHRAILTGLLPAEHAGEAATKLRPLFEELNGVLRGLSLLREASAAALDRAMSFGERFANTMMTAVLEQRGVPAHYVDARPLVLTDEHFGRAVVDLDTTCARIRERLAGAKGVSFVTGFIGATADGVTTTLGRGGSDYTAALFGAALGAREIEIWTDVDGLMSADPGKVPLARLIRNVTYEEAMELSHFGARVIYPLTLQPALEKGIPIRVRNTFRREIEGTRISATNPPISRAVKGLSSIEDVALLHLTGSGMVGVTGISARLFGALARAGANVIMITQGSSEHSITLAVEPRRVEDARRAVEEEFAFERRAHRIDPVRIEHGRSVVAVVGENMRRTPGIAGMIFTALGRQHVNVVAIAQGSSELNVSIVVDRDEEIRALQAIHDAFFREETDPHRAEVYVLGTGVVGSTLLGMLAEHGDSLRAKRALDLRLCGVANSRRMALDPHGLDLAGWRGDLSEKAEPMDLEAFLARVTASPHPSRILVDCTASSRIMGFYPDLLEAGLNLVTPNKLANSAPMDFYRRVHTMAAGRYMYETTVGAGLPVIGTIQDLLKSGDEILRIDAVLSGSLSYVLNTASAQTPLSTAVREARERGYTEPDPRTDLSGLDMARKFLILARETGRAIELEDIRIESLVPLGDGRASVDAFLEGLRAQDDAFERRRAAAEAGGRILRYVGTLDGDGARVGLCEVDASSPFRQLRGTENMVIFTSRRYNESPLVVQGPGAGADVTAAGILADVIRAARMRQGQ